MRAYGVLLLLAAAILFFYGKQTFCPSCSGWDVFNIACHFQVLFCELWIGLASLGLGLIGLWILIRSQE